MTRVSDPAIKQPREQLGVLAIGLDPIRPSPRGLAGRDHLHLDPRRDRRAIEPEPGRARLITRPHRARQRPQPRDRRLHTARTAPASARPSSHRSPRHAPSGHGHRTQPTSSFRARPDLLNHLGSAGAALRPDKPPRGASGHQPDGQPVQPAARAIGSSVASAGGHGQSSAGVRTGRTPPVTTIGREPKERCTGRALPDDAPHSSAAGPSRVLPLSGAAHKFRCRPGG